MDQPKHWNPLITIDIADAVTVHSPGGVLVLRAPIDHPLLPTLSTVLDSPSDAFRRLAQVIVEHNFDVPAIACVIHSGTSHRIFLIGDINAHIRGAGQEALIGSGTSTWIEQDLEPNSTVDIVAPEARASEQLTNQPSINIEIPEVDPSGRDDGREWVQAAVPAPPIPPPGTREPTAAATAPAVPVLSSQSVPNGGAHSSGSSAMEGIAAHWEPPTEGTEQRHGASAGLLPTPDVEATLDAASVRARISGGTERETATNGPLVTARVCPCGTANPLVRAECRTCGSSLRRDGVTIGQAPRPPLGFIVFDDGFRHELTAPVVVGRSAPIDHLIEDVLAEAITVASPQKHVSKAHVEVRLIDWTVNIVDLDSANGTYVEGADGRSPRRLRPNVVEQITSGDVVQFGDRSFTFEATDGL